MGFARLTRPRLWDLDAASASEAVSARHGFALASLSGLIYGLSLTLEPAWLRAPLGLVALAPFFTVVVRASVAQAVTLGVLWTVAATTVVASWLPATLESYFGLSPAVSAGAFVLLALGVNAPPYALLAAWLSWRARCAPVAPLVVGAGFMLAEMARSFGLVPNPYASLGLSQIGAPTAQVAELIGGFGVSGLAATTGALAAAVVCPELRGTRPWRDSTLATAALVFAIGFGLYAERPPEAPSGETVHVGVIQPGIAPSRAVSPDDARVETQLVLSRAALDSDDAPDLLFWPEHAVAFYPREDTDVRAAFLEQASALGVDLVFGAPHYRNGDPRPSYYASLFLLKEGRLAGRTDKRALVPFAEYDPLGGLLPLETAGYHSGESFRPLEARGARIGGFLCGEVLFPSVARELSLAGATLLSNPSNDGWFASERATRHQILSARMRAIENRRPVVRAATNGYSAVIDARGGLVGLSTRGSAEVLTARVEPSALVTPFQRHPHVVVWLAVLALAGSTLTFARRAPHGGSARFPSTPKGSSP